MKKIPTAVTALLVVLLCCHWAAADAGPLQDEYLALKKQAKKAGGTSELPDGQRRRLLEVKYMLGSDEERPLPLKEARELAQLEIASRKSGGMSRLPEVQYQRVLALRIMKGDYYNKPLPTSEANELAKLQVEARKVGGESGLPAQARQRLKELRFKVSQGGSANPFF